MWVSFFFSSRRRHTRFKCDWSSDVCSSDLAFSKFESTWLTPNQSDTRNPPNASSPFSNSVSRYLWAWSLWPFQLLYEIMMLSAPAAMASWDGGRGSHLRGGLPHSVCAGSDLR